MTSLRAWLIRKTLPALRKATQPERRSARVMRAGMEAFMKRFPKPEPMFESPFSLEGISGRKVSVSATSDAETAIVFFHGGGYAMGSSRTHRFLAARLSSRMSAPVFLPDYRLAPEHPFPAAVEDVVSVWKNLTAAHPSVKHWLLGGDSAGGGLALALLQEIKRLALVRPAGTFLFSPWADLSADHKEHRLLEKKDPYLDVAIIRQWGEQYAGKNLRHPLASVIHGEYEHAGPVLLQVGTHEVLYQDACMLKEKLEKAQGVSLHFSIWEGMFHGFQMCEGMFPEAGKALDEFAVWAKQIMEKP